MINKQKILLFILFALLFIPVVVFAQAGVPDIGQRGGSGFICETDDNLTKCIPRLYNFALGMSGIIALAVIILSGYMYMTAGGDGEQLKTAKGLIAGLISGIVILATAYVLLRFLNPQLVVLNEPFRYTAAGVPTTTGQITPLPIGGVGPDGTPAPGSYSDAQARAALSGKVQVAPGITLNGIKIAVVNEVISLKNECSTILRVPCEVVITSATGGTSHEQGACSHYSGDKVDFRSRDPSTGAQLSITNYIQSHFRPNGSRSNGDRRYVRQSTGSGYVLEENPPSPRPPDWAPHWDVAVGCSG